MNESSDEPPLPDRIRSWARTRAHASHFNPFGADDSQRQPANLASANSSTPRQDGDQSTSNTSRTSKVDTTPFADTSNENDAEKPKSSTAPQVAPEVDAQGEGEESTTIDRNVKPSIFHRFWYDVKRIIMYNPWINWLLVFVPVGVALGAMEKSMGQDKSPVSPTVVFSINAVAIIPLAGLLAFATESVASKMGDTIGALMNVTFGNAVELIIFIIALVAKEIRIVQASLLGSILANLLLILGMCFLFGGLRFREQLYNSTVGQMSACLLSLSVISLLLPTAFHFSFNSASQTKADHVVTKVSRGVSVVLLLVYILYLLFQLKSHAYMYESTPQHLIDEESHPGVLAEMLNSSSSSDTSSTSGSDSDVSSGSHTTAKRIKRAFRRRRKSSISSHSKETPSAPSMNRTPSSLTNNTIEELPQTTSPMELDDRSPHVLEPVFSGDEADVDERHRSRRGTQTSLGVTSRDFQTERTSNLSVEDVEKKKKTRSHHRRKKHSRKQKSEASDEKDPEKAVGSTGADADTTGNTRSPRVEFATPPAQESESSDTQKKPFNIRGLTRPAMPKVLSSTVFSQPSGQTLPPPNASPNQARGLDLRRTSSLPEMSRPQTRPSIASKPSGPVPLSAQPLPHLMPVQTPSADNEEEEEAAAKHLSKTSAVILLLVSTGLVAACAEFLVDSIDFLVESTGVSQAFIGLIILPIVGNAAEHVTAVTVASKNKMDLAIGVALGSSIQIALFVTPIIVLLGWCLDTDMSLYFSLFETVSLFASAFIVNYLMIDGRSNYLEGALLIAAYVIIAVAAYFYPSCEDLSAASGPTDGTGSC